MRWHLLEVALTSYTYTQDLTHTSVVFEFTQLEPTYMIFHMIDSRKRDSCFWVYKKIAM